MIQDSVIVTMNDKINRNSYAIYRIVPFPMILSDLDSDISMTTHVTKTVSS